MLGSRARSSGLYFLLKSWGVWSVGRVLGFGAFVFTVSV